MRRNRASSSSTSDVMEITALQHTLSTIALCSCALTHSYLLISVFTYSGFLAIDLVPSANEENAGSYAGLIASAFMIGRATTSYGWGKAADIYGRTTVINASLVFSFIFSILFGLAGNFCMALVWRFMLGLGNGIMGSAKTAVSELAGSNKDLETRGMSLVLCMWGWGFLISPVISGALAEPVKQYPSVEWLQQGEFSDFLSRRPFALPNFVGAIMCLVSLVVVHTFVTETLPPEKCRSPRYIPIDIWNRLRGNNSNGTEEERARIVPNVLPTIVPANDRRDSYGLIEHEDDIELPSNIMALLEDDIEETIRISKLQNDEQVAMLATATSTPRNSIAHSIARRTSVAAYNHRVSTMLAADPDKPATIASLWADETTRNHLIVYWMFSFLMVAVDESFPLFCISKSGGLGLSENSIGKILSASGLIYATAQYGVYAFLIQRMGLYGSMRVGALLGGPIVVLIPISLYLNRNQPDDVLAWAAFAFLSILMAVYRIFALALFSSLIVATNRTVAPSHRGTMNGLAGLGGSVAKGVGPAFAGILVAFSLSSGVLTPVAGAVFMFVVIGVLAALGLLAVYVLLRDPNEHEGSVELKV